MSIDVQTQGGPAGRAVGVGAVGAGGEGAGESVNGAPGVAGAVELGGVERDVCTYGSTIRLSEVISALSYALDITEGQPEGHAVRSCLIGMRLAAELGLGAEDRSALYYASQLKDLGCSSNAAKMSHLLGADDQVVKRNVKTVEWTRLIPRAVYALKNVAPEGTVVQKIGRFMAVGVAGDSGARDLIKVRCERGASIAKGIGLPDKAAEAIRSLDEHWNGKGHPAGLAGDQIPLLSRIMGLAQTVEVFVTRHGLDAAMEMARDRRGRWFDPELVDLLVATRGDEGFWGCLGQAEIHKAASGFEPEDQVMVADDGMLDRVAAGFADVVDAKSPWTYRHTLGVTELAVGIGTAMGLGGGKLRDLRRAALLHDIGKLGVSNRILDKAGRLTDDERAAMQKHAEYTKCILDRVAGFSSLSHMAAAHHERVDGNGYYRGIGGKHLTKSMRALVVADMFEAMTAQRPYRDTMPIEKVLGILESDVGTAVCPEAVHSLKFHLDTVGFTPSRLPESEG